MKNIPLAILLFLTTSAFAQNNLSVGNSGKVWSAAYQQRAAEYKALCFQAYNIAKMRLDEAVRLHKKGKPLAVVTDIDETLLDNSPEGARAGYANEGFNNTKWQEWTARAVADTVPGAAEFFKYAAKKHVTVFYITNRGEKERAATLKNLQLYDLPFADDAHLFLRDKVSSKETRRQIVLARYNIVLLCGDNLPDFDVLYDNPKSEEGRAEVTHKLKAQFGKKYIVIPNPSYGDWENGLYDFRSKLTNGQKDSLIRAKVKTQ
ncbi:5'-nucleotidase, lipoprotein e(P4) family [Mucilaginibacter ginkgonis]|uniref:5'-nucleotidase, lipoprotein e(P4) family n=1 Tax=Mucilaginibacter ginkgonis TaxID=2682091 RepID=A0A6I4IMR7_9SPHI|nr:5'-nucleotidase, lipoprotein e(P4) family [Mucilaginibacter ginkgonis]QQL49821.1 5'-nucleotidase, lipoprotein e(P4) family [Mucilaginibacter ginkgonis]